MSDGMYADLMGTAISSVNYYEIAENYIDKIEVEEEEPETA